MNMKLVIDIDEHIWNMVVNTGTFGCYRFNTSRAIRKGVPLDKIRAEIDSHCCDNRDRNDGLYIAMKIIDKYRSEGE